MNKNSVQGNMLTEELAKEILSAISKSNRKNLTTQITARMDVVAGELSLTIAGNFCTTKGQAWEVIQNINEIYGLNIQVENYA